MIPMSASEDPQERVGNRLLSAFPSEVYRRLQPELEAVSMGPKDVVYEPHGPIPHVYFPTGCIVSLVAIMGDGSMFEVATVGQEGMIGLPHFLETDTAPYRAVTQVPGEALRLDAGVFRDAIGRSGEGVQLLHRYAQVLFNQVAWSAACNRAHSLEQRCARWLLMTHDRVHSSKFLLTQDFLAQMLGVHRPRVNRAAGALQKAGLIRYVRGRITVLDREGLEAAACECYRVIRSEYERLLD
jgi:CRP-like cAMP-binding protein